MENPELTKSPNSIIKKIIKDLGNIVLVMVTLVIGFTIGYYYTTLKNQLADKTPIVNVKTMKETSVGVNERHELLIIDRATGNYIIYSDSVGTAIFDVYANRKYQTIIKQ